MCNGLRNWLFHRYNKLDKKLVLESVEKVKETLLEFIKRVERVIKKRALRKSKKILKHLQITKW